MRVKSPKLATASTVGESVGVDRHDGRADSAARNATQRSDSVTLRAELDCIVALSACPQDILPINGRTGTTTEAHYEITG